MRVPTDGMPAWMVSMRRAAQEVVKEADIREIVQTQMQKAKSGDKEAIKFVFEQVLGGSAFKGATFIQTQKNYHGRRRKRAEVVNPEDRS